VEIFCRRLSCKKYYLVLDSAGLGKKIIGTWCVGTVLANTPLTTLLCESIAEAEKLLVLSSIEDYH